MSDDESSKEEEEEEAEAESTEDKAKEPNSATDSIPCEEGLSDPNLPKYDFSSLASTID